MTVRIHRKKDLADADRRLTGTLAKSILLCLKSLQSDHTVAGVVSFLVLSRRPVMSKLMTYVAYAHCSWR